MNFFLDFYSYLYEILLKIAINLYKLKGFPSCKSNPAIEPKDLDVSGRFRVGRMAIIVRAGFCLNQEKRLVP
jgi:hypothetical protein